MPCNNINYFCTRGYLGTPSAPPGRCPKTRALPVLHCLKHKFYRFFPQIVPSSFCCHHLLLIYVTYRNSTRVFRLFAKFPSFTLRSWDFYSLSLSHVIHLCSVFSISLFSYSIFWYFSTLGTFSAILIFLFLSCFFAIRFPFLYCFLFFISFHSSFFFTAGLSAFHMPHQRGSFHFSFYLHFLFVKWKHHIKDTKKHTLVTIKFLIILFLL